METEISKCKNLPGLEAFGKPWSSSRKKLAAGQERGWERKHRCVRWERWL